MDDRIAASAILNCTSSFRGLGALQAPPLALLSQQSLSQQNLSQQNPHFSADAFLS
jgi:hypothetical protein